MNDPIQQILDWLKTPEGMATKRTVLTWIWGAVSTAALYLANLATVPNVIAAQGILYGLQKLAKEKQKETPQQ